MMNDGYSMEDALEVLWVKDDIKKTTIDTFNGVYSMPEIGEKLDKELEASVKIIEMLIDEDIVAWIRFSRYWTTKNHISRLIWEGFSKEKAFKMLEVDAKTKQDLIYNLIRGKYHE